MSTVIVGVNVEDCTAKADELGLARHAWINASPDGLHRGYLEGLRLGEHSIAVTDQARIDPACDPVIEHLFRCRAKDPSDGGDSRLPSLS